MSDAYLGLDLLPILWISVFCSKELVWAGTRITIMISCLDTYYSGETRK